MTTEQTTRSTAATHTPGPWEAVGFGVYANWTDETDASRVSEIIFGNHNTRGGTPEERRANARLIASAPALLAALENVARVTDSHYQTCTRKPGKCSQCSASIYARAAIAQARGEA
jgi:hypothetical protein